MERNAHESDRQRHENRLKRLQPFHPRGPRTGNKRIYRGGSWKSRIVSLRATARHFNSPDYSSNDVGFRVICECD